MQTAPEPIQRWNADEYVDKVGFVSDLVADVWAMLDPKPGERILDVGCGDGRLTQRLVDAGCHVIGVDASESMIAAAQNKGLNAQVMDGHALALDQTFDAVFSNAALHWMPDPDAVILGVKQHLRPGGRFVAEFGGLANVAAIITAMRAAALAFDGDAALAHPWYFPTEAAHATRLEKAGFQIVKMERVGRLTSLPAGMIGWLDVFRKPFFDQFEGETRDAVLTYVHDLLAPSLYDESGQWWADYARLRFHAILPA